MRSTMTRARASGRLAAILLATGVPSMPPVAIAGGRDDAAAVETRREPRAIRRGTLHVGSLERSFRYYVPSGPGARPALVLAFHGSGGDGARIRGFVGRELERLAEAHGFLVAYPDGYEGHWNDCRARAPFTANTRAIDDVSFVRALVSRLGLEYGVDPARVYALGFSNGGHLAYRLALETPGEVAAVAALGASLPAEDEIDCSQTGRPVSVMIVNGTADTINPYEGGEVVLTGGRTFGRVRSAQQSAAYFARLAGHGDGDAPAHQTVVGAAAAGEPWVERTGWSRPGTPEVSLYTVHGGGHTIPGPRAGFPPFLGPTERRFDAVSEAVAFFLRRAAARHTSQDVSAAAQGSYVPARDARARR